MTAFTDRFVKGLRPRDRLYEERDSALPGLLIRVNANGRKVWEVVVARDGKRRRVRLGEYPAVSLAAARRLAFDAKSAPTIHAGGMRMRDLWGLYEAEVAPTRRSWRDIALAWTKWCEPLIASVRVEDLNIRHGAEIIAHVSKVSSPARAAKVIRYVTPALRWAHGRGLIPTHPWRDLRLPEGPPSRDRVLDLEEWRAVARWAGSAPYPWGPLILALQLSAARLNEVAGMQWSEIREDRWEIPARRHKSKRPHVVPFAPRLGPLIRGLPRTDATFVFSTQAGRPIAPGSKLKARIDREAGVSSWRLHDLRRSAATIMSRGGVTRFVVERALGHADRSVTAAYDRYDHFAEKLEALTILERSLDG